MTTVNIYNGENVKFHIDGKCYGTLQQFLKQVDSTIVDKDKEIAQLKAELIEIKNDLKQAHLIYDSKDKVDKIRLEGIILSNISKIKHLTR